MLKFLHIENIAVIEKTDIEFFDGLSALTGETGAGKSIIIDAINAILGERTSKELIRNGSVTANVTAQFCNLSEAAKNAVTEAGYDLETDETLLIDRTLSLKGNGSVRINGRPAAVSILKNIGRYLINIHGQHDNQNLLDPENHYIYVDRLAENERLKSEYYNEFHKLNTIRKEIAKLSSDLEEKKRRKDLIEFEINELSGADIKIGETENLRKKQKIAENYSKMITSLNEAYSFINGDDNFDGAASLIKNAQKSLIASDCDEMSESISKAADILSDLEEICSDIRTVTHNEEYSELDIETINLRLDTLRRLSVKYNADEAQMLSKLEELKDELLMIDTADEKIEKLSEELDFSTERLVELGERLSQSRIKAGNKFCKEVTSVLKFLDMPNVTFQMKHEKGRYTKFGCDIIEFMICTNIGEAMKPLHKIASGGELSRIMLAIKSVLSDKDGIDTLIFDEIDSGISGRAAGKVGIQLKKASADKQVLCVTHLAQIAANADNQYLIEKTVKDGKTYTNVSLLSYEERIKEIARIMSGNSLTDSLYNSAKELLDRSNNNENL